MPYRKMKMFFRRLFLHFKNIKAMFFVPLVMSNVLVPAVAYFSYNSEYLDFYMTVMQASFILIPLSSCIWSLFVLREYVEGKGNELLYVGRNKVKLLDCLIPFLLFSVTIIIQYLFYIQIDNIFKFEFIRIFIICLFFFSLTYLFAFLTKSVSLTLMILIGYTIINIMFGLDTSNVFIFYYNLERFTKAIFFNQSLPMLITSLVVIGFGVIINKRISKFN